LETHSKNIHCGKSHIFFGQKGKETHQQKIVTTPPKKNTSAKKHRQNLSAAG
jgi:hypothetical protein